MPVTPLAGWHPDPYKRYHLRYWNGLAWTEHVSSQGHMFTDPLRDLAAGSNDQEFQPVASWHPDPTGRHQLRHWDGHVWSHHVMSQGVPSVDPLPIELEVPQQEAPHAEAHATIRPGLSRPPQTTGAKPSGKVKRQARRAGAITEAPGGGTLLTEQVLVVNQKAKLLGSTLSYAIFSQEGLQLGTIQETGRTLGSKVADSIVHSADRRTHRFQVVDTSNRVILSLTRPALGWFSSKGSVIVEGPTGTEAGRIVLESWGVAGALKSLVGVNSGGHARFALEAGGRRLGLVNAESFAKWDFHVTDPTGEEIARITKTWAGWAKERFTKADNYVLQMHRPLDEPLRSLVMATALAIDVQFKQRGKQTHKARLSRRRRYN